MKSCPTAQHRRNPVSPAQATGLPHFEIPGCSGTRQHNWPLESSPNRRRDDAKLPRPDKLKQVQKLMDQGDYRARKIYETIGTYLGYAIAHFSDFYELENVLILGRVTSGPGGDIIIAGAKEVLKAEFPELTGKIAFHIPDEKDKRHGQAVAAASLPKLG